MSLKCVVLLVRDVGRSVQFYTEVLGVAVTHFSHKWAELDAGGVKLAVKAVDGEAECSTGYSPLLSFSVDDLPTTVSKAIALGASLDGPIKFPIFGKVAALRSPDGHMIGLHEPADDLPEVDVPILRAPPTQPPPTSNQ